MLKITELNSDLEHQKHHIFELFWGQMWCFKTRSSRSVWKPLSFWNWMSPVTKQDELPCIRPFVLCVWFCVFCVAHSIYSMCVCMVPFLFGRQPPAAVFQPAFKSVSHLWRPVICQQTTYPYTHISVFLKIQHSVTFFTSCPHFEKLSREAEKASKEPN